MRCKENQEKHHIESSFRDRQKIFYKNHSIRFLP